MPDIAYYTIGTTQYSLKDLVSRERIGVLENWVSSAIDMFYPIGSVIINLGVNPGTYLEGTTWERTAVGKAIVGIDTANELMDTVEESFGQADAIIPSHTHSITGGSHSHTVNAHAHQAVAGWYWSVYKGTRTSEDIGGISGNTNRISQVSISSGGNWSGSQWTQNASPGTDAIAHTHDCSDPGEDVTNKNYQPSMAFYIWKRTA